MELELDSPTRAKDGAIALHEKISGLEQELETIDRSLQQVSAFCCSIRTSVLDAHMNANRGTQSCAWARLMHLLIQRGRVTPVPHLLERKWHVQFRVCRDANQWQYAELWTTREPIIKRPSESFSKTASS